MTNPFASKGPTPELGKRLPPNQRLTDGWPILHEGQVPSIDMATWDLKVWGEVEAEKRFDWDALMAMPQTKLVTDFHCVTGWSKFDNVWEGVRFVDLVQQLGVKPEAKYVMAYGHLGADPLGYDTNIALEVLMNPEVLLVHSHNGKPLTPDHGFPLRLMVPHRFAWKSAKWLRGLEFLAANRRGYWEERGYHNNAEPFAEERYASQERPEERMHVRGKDYT